MGQPAETNLSLTYIDTKAKAFHICNSLINMKQQMTNTAGYIVNFTTWVHNQVRKKQPICNLPLETLPGSLD